MVARGRGNARPARFGLQLGGRGFCATTGGVRDALRGHLVFACGAGLYGVPSELASEVVNLPTLTRVPGAPAHVLGVFALRGEVLPVIDLTRLLGSPPPEQEWKRAVVLRVAQGVVALTATRVLGVASLEGNGGPLGNSGVQQHLKGPFQAPAGDVATVDPEGLVAFLARGG